MTRSTRGFATNWLWTTAIRPSRGRRNLTRSTHTIGAFYEAFPADEARELVKRVEFRHTPNHGSWLNIAENELSALTRQCVGRRRFGTIEELRAAAWSASVNAKQRGVDWQFRIGDAQIKLKSLYPKTPT